jgi:phage terminase large subunit
MVWTTDAETGLNRVFVPARLQDNPTLMTNDPNYVKMLNGLPDGLREAWRDGSWDDPIIEGAYYTLALAQARREGRIKLVPHDPSLKVHTVWDLGIGPQLVCAFVQKTATEIRVIDSWQGQGSDGLPEAAVMLQNKPYLYGKHYAPHDASKTETGSGKTIIQQAAELGIVFDRIPSIGVNDGINKALMMFPRLYLSEPKSEQLLSSLRNYRKKWDESRLDWLDEPFKDWSSHFADVIRYLALVEDEMTNTGQVPYRQPRQESDSIYYQAA